MFDFSEMKMGFREPRDTRNHFHSLLQTVLQSDVPIESILYHFKLKKMRNIKKKIEESVVIWIITQGKRHGQRKHPK